MKNNLEKKTTLCMTNKYEFKNMTPQKCILKL